MALTLVRARRSATVLALAVAVFGAVLGALAGAAVAERAAWQAAGPLPSDREASALARLVMGAAVPPPERFDVRFGYDPSGAYGPGRVRFRIPGERPEPALSDSRVRLATAGWTVSPTAGGFSAVKGPWRVEFAPDGDAFVRLDVLRARPMWVAPVAAFGGLLGALCGWLVTLWVWRRGVRLPDGAPRRVALGFAAAGALCAVPVLAVTGYTQLPTPLDRPLWTALTYQAVGLAAAASLVLLAAAALLVTVRSLLRR
ncbi:hypothetical protein Val02_54430 [Virgisporangium aliadipatigenens]|uniref:Uncharacterized protein n=1 Tax=Virgisporangium aliadipatigenens TaxID=741659 RepID=A0A8J3YQ72_9ACTN|nr:hypothetical protein [Virgisporangium aliadipatigenens]GIJ48557.1 hypothetical protein Val02_54430 [Virgisporangium aliadipatigenens]